MSANINNISRAEAEELLELDSIYSAEDVKTNYRRLIKKAHPDSGGTEEQALALNKAKALIDKLIVKNPKGIFSRQRPPSTSAPIYTMSDIEAIFESEMAQSGSSTEATPYSYTTTSTTTVSTDATSSTSSDTSTKDDINDPDAYKEPKWYSVIYNFMDHPIIWRIITTGIIIVIAFMNMLDSQIVSMWSGLDILFEFALGLFVALINLLTGFTYKILFAPIKFVINRILDLTTKKRS